MQDFDFLRPKTLTELIEILADTSGCILAGGTDIIPKMRRAQFMARTLVDISEIDELRFIKMQDHRIQIGSLATHHELANSPILSVYNPALVASALTIGCEQTRNRGTLGGNIANASPAADTIPSLMTFDAIVHLLSKTGERALPLNEFLDSPGKTKLNPGELIHSVSFEPLTGDWGASFLKLGKRNGMAISVVSASAAVVLDPDKRIMKTRLCLGSVASRVVRSPKAEKILMGQYPTEEIIDNAAHACIGDISPISDIRSTAEYRKHAAVVLTRRVLEQSIDHAFRRIS
jgi:CO/xanthine dehydrogenase FAD-binding subunit